MEQLKLSIIVPVYNVEEYLTECLDSIDRSIKNISAEVLLINDGSTDASGEIAEAYAREHAPFFCYSKENGGLSLARNYGAARAKGEYICFVDSDDIVAENMYENMLKAAEYHQADLTIVNVARFNSKETHRSNLHIRVFSDLTEDVVHISSCDNLIYDTTAWNKLIRRSFWEENGFEYPVGWRFEDMPVSLAMHCKANKVAVVREVGYLWRVRDGESRSITQQNTSILNLSHRIAMLDSMYDYIRDEMHGDKRLRNLLADKNLLTDVPIYIDQAVEIQDEEERREYCEIIRKFLLRNFTEEDYVNIPVIQRKKFEHIIEDDYDALVEIVRFDKKFYKNLQYVQYGEDIKVQLPEELFGISETSVLGDVRFDIPRISMTDLRITGARVIITGYCYVRRVDIPDPESQTFRCYLLNAVTGRKKELKVTRVLNRDLTDLQGKVYDNSNKEKYRYSYDGTAFAAELDLDDEDMIRSFSGDNFVLVEYENKYRQGSFVMRSTTDNWDDVIGGSAYVNNTVKVRIRFDATKHLIFTVSENESGCAAEGISGRSFINRDGSVRELGDEQAFVADSIDETGGRVTIHVRTPDDASGWDRAQLVYFDALSEKIVGLSDKTDHSSVRESGAILRIDFNDAAFMKDMYVGIRHIEVMLTEGSDSRQVPVYVNGFMCVKLENDGRKLIFTSDSDGRMILVVINGSILAGNYKLFLRKQRYPEYRKEPINKKCILFEAYWGAQYSCNPRALYEYIDKHHPEYTCVWSFKDEKTPINGNGIRVQKYSDEYYHYLATAKYLVNNVNFETAYRKRRGQIEIQTMHGTPYKSMGLDVKSDFKDEKAVEQYIKKSKRWNYLIVQGRFTESMAWQWFRYDGKMLETGYPRTDHLFHITDKEVLGLKKKYGIPEDKKVILYAPTFRQRGVYEMPLDLDRMRAELSDEYVLMIRLHHFTRQSYIVPEDGEFIFDMGKYSVIDDFFKIADMMITDYSSVMFDFALTGKPQIFYTYDLEEYTTSLRGSCFDIQKEAPGPVVRTMDELMDAIKGDPDEYIERRNQFFDEYLTYENGNSAEKIFEEVIASREKPKVPEKKRRSLMSRINGLFRRLQRKLLKNEETRKK